ncbi:hypothetical protein [Streptomyces sp. UH6]|uniref:hypothetical protein n=1 Tax=Streptomyces sp. UH6 TaxID=2748379 RepID=UPI0015D4C7CF|nr:hypothetical protein [Streptomyces sp. UH6]NYV73368.1 hypothetical protein [Streptomyces sp. UH6]
MRAGRSFCGHKTGTAFTKPVGPILGQAVDVRQTVRPDRPKFTDRRTGERVDLLFADERPAVDVGQTALDKLFARLADVPTPAGPTPRQIGIPPNAALLPLVEVRRSAPLASAKEPTAPGVHRRKEES